MVTHDAVETNDSALAACAQPESEINILAAVLEGLLETAKVQKIHPAHETAGRRDRKRLPRAAGKLGQRAHMGNLA